MIRGALELAGVEFIDENGGGPGVRLRRPVEHMRQKSRKEEPAQAEEAAGAVIDKVLKGTGQPQAVKASRKRKLTKMPPELTQLPKAEKNGDT